MLPAYYWIEVDANAVNGTITQTIPTPVINSGACRAHAAMLELSSHSQPFLVDCYFSSYNQGGVTKSGHFREISGKNITEIFCTVTVTNCFGVGGFFIELF
jgi:hypothetical protein